MERVDSIIDNERQKKAYFDFDEKHSDHGPGIKYKLNGQSGKLYPDSAFLPWHETFMLAGVEPPKVEWKRKQLIFKYYETRAERAHNDFKELQHKLGEQCRYAEELAGHPNAVMPPDDAQIMELKVRLGVAKACMADFERKREELGDVRDPDDLARENQIQGIREWARRQGDKIVEIQL